MFPLQCRARARSRYRKQEGGGVSQNAKLLVYLESHDGVTQLEAFNGLGICRLSERCRELERLGFLIEHEPERTSGGARVIRYRLQRIACG